MDIQYYGGNCIGLSNKEARIIIDDNLAELGLKSVAKNSDIILSTHAQKKLKIEPKLIVDQPGEYEVSGLSIIGIAARGHIDEPGSHLATMYKIIEDDTSYLITGHVYPDLTDNQLESIGIVDVMFVPVGGNGYTLDATGALQLIKKIEPKIVIPTHFDDGSETYPVPQQSLEQVLKNLSMEPKETVSKLRYKPQEIGGTTQLVILSRS